MESSVSAPGSQSKLIQNKKRRRSKKAGGATDFMKQIKEISPSPTFFVVHFGQQHFTAAKKKKRKEIKEVETIYLI